MYHDYHKNITEDLSNDCWKFSRAVIGINYIWKYIQMKNSYFKL